MKTKPSFVIFFILCLFVPQLTFAFDVSDFQYFRDLPMVEQAGQVKLDLDQQVFQHSNYQDLVLVDQANQSIPFNLFSQEYVFLPAQVLNSSDAKADYQGKTFVGKNVFDGDLETAFMVENSSENPFQASLLIDLGKETSVAGVNLSLSKFSKVWQDLKIEGSLDNQDFSPLQIKKLGANTQFFISFPASNFRYLKINFTYLSQLSIAEIHVLGAAQSSLVFTADPVKIYRLFYGSSQLSLAIPQLLQTKAEDLPVLNLGEEKVNPEFNADRDGDGILISQDNCPEVANPDQKDNDQDGLGDVCDLTPFMRTKDVNDFDFDGVYDLSDNCPFFKNTNQLDRDNNGIGDACDDSDGDTLPASVDNCPTLKNYDQKDADSNGIGDLCEGDYDQDGVKQELDNCSEIANPDQKDTDGDGIGDACDNCPGIKNPEQIDLNQNGKGDLCEDSDQDQVLDSEDNCKLVANPDQKDTDGDGVGDACDNCKMMKNASQWDDNNDGVGNECADDDQDGVLNKEDNCPLNANPDQKDSDNDGVGDVCIDTDNDHVIDLSDNCPQHGNPDQADTDQDGLGDVCDPQTDKPMGVYEYVYWGGIGLIGAGFVYYLISLVLQIISVAKKKD